MFEIMKTNLDHFYGDYVVCATDRIYGEDDPVYVEMIKVLRQKGISEEDVFGLELPSGRTYILKRRV
jgi:hypothetical protein